MNAMNTPAESLSTWTRVCAVLMGALGFYVLLSGDLTWWRIALAGLLLACPLTMLRLTWMYGRNGRDLTARHKEIHDGS